jgi:hypothetical protein
VTKASQQQNQNENENAVLLRYADMITTKCAAAEEE